MPGMGDDFRKIALTALVDMYGRQGKQVDAAKYRALLAAEPERPAR
jgi:hypothetical protein